MFNKVSYEDRIVKEMIENGSLFGKFKPYKLLDANKIKKVDDYIRKKKKGIKK